MFFLWENIINIKKVNNKKIILLSFKRLGFIVPTTFSRIVATAKTVREENIDDIEEYLKIRDITTQVKINMTVKERDRAKSIPK